ncbi:MAG TPA: serine hydrolase domain-containing protein [Kofleriaceae bacterium]
MRSAWVGLLVSLVACGGSDVRPVLPKPVAAEPAPVPGPAPVAVKPAEPVVEQLFVPPAAASTFADPERRAKLAAAFPAIDKALELERATQGVPGLAVGIVIDGELAYAKGFGVVDPSTKAVPDADTVYRIGSISKSFTGLALLSLRDDGVLGIDDALARWIPEANKLVYPTRDARPITLRQLAQHTSGLPRDGFFNMEANPDEATVVGSLAKITLDRAPGLESVYSNLGFGLLGIVVSRAAKRPLHDVIASRIFTPLGMTSTSWDQASVPADHLAPAFREDGTAKPRARLGAVDGAGGIYSTVRDMARYASFLLAAYPPRDDGDRGPIRRATIREAQYSGFALDAQVMPKPEAKHGEPSVELDSSSYGFGWVRRQTCTVTDEIMHNGAIDSYRSALVLRPSRGVGVIVMTNFGATNTVVFAERALDLLAATGAMRPREPALPAPSTYMPIMSAFLDVYNAFDKDKLAALLARPVDPREPDELAGYKALHGSCSAFKLKGIVDGNLDFAMTCEHGPFDLVMTLRGDKLFGFTGRSPGVAPPENVKKLIAAALALHFDVKWNDATYKLVFPNHLISATQVRSVGANLRSDFGTCKQTSVLKEGTGWSVDLDCSKGRPITFSIQLDAHGVLDGINFRPAPGAAEAPRCPTR